MREDRQEKTLVMEVGNSHAVVCSRQFKIRRVPLSSLPSGVRPGEEVVLSEHERTRRRRILPFPAALGASLALAAALLALFVFMPALLAPDSPQPVALAVVDINPAVTLQMDGSGSVISLISQDEAGRHLIGQMELDSGPLPDVLNHLVLTAVSLDLLDPLSQSSAVFLSLISLDPENQVFGEDDAERLEFSLSEALASRLSQPPGALIRAWRISQEDLERAREMGLSPNRFVVARGLEQAGIEIDPEELAEKPLGQIVAEEVRQRGLEIRDIVAPHRAQPGPPPDIQPGPPDGMRPDSDPPEGPPDEPQKEPGEKPRPGPEVPVDLPSFREP